MNIPSYIWLYLGSKPLLDLSLSPSPSQQRQVQHHLCRRALLLRWEKDLTEVKEIMETNEAFLGGTPKWLVYEGKSHLEMDDDSWYPYDSGNLQIYNELWILVMISIGFLVLVYGNELYM